MGTLTQVQVKLLVLVSGAFLTGCDSHKIEKLEKQNQEMATQLKRQEASLQSAGASDFRGDGSIQDIAKLSWVNRRCRLWGADGDIDIDQTCIVVRKVGGGLMVIPDEYNDADFKEATDNLTSGQKDKWLTRFYAIGGGEKPQTSNTKRQSLDEIFGDKK